MGYPPRRGGFAGTRTRGITGGGALFHPCTIRLVLSSCCSTARQKLDCTYDEITLEHLTQEMAGGNELEALTHELGRK